MMRFGNSALEIQFNGTAPNATQSPQPSTQFSSQWKKAKDKWKNRTSGFYDSVIDPELNQIDATLKLADQILSSKKFKTVLFIGIGGSSLGPIALLEALHPQTQDRLQFRFLENPDPLDWKRKTQDLNPDTTLVVVVTKSGGTYETMGLWTLALQFIGESRWKTHCVALTDPNSGELRRIVNALGLMNLCIDSTIGGRFSIFTPVGTFALALAQLDPRKFLEGAEAVREYCENVPDSENIFGSWVHFLFSHAVQQNNHVLMPYSTVARVLANWWVQLWAESLGKDRKGFTAIPAQGATDQHSIQQLLRDGPNDKIIWFLEIGNAGYDLSFPKLNLGTNETPTCSQLVGRTMQELLRIELRATEQVFANQKRPYLTMKLNDLSEYSLGSYFFAQCVLTAVMAEVLDVNAYDQPGVEEGKIYIKQQLSNQQ